MVYGHSVTELILKNPRACPKKGPREEAERSKPRREKGEATKPTTPKQRKNEEKKKEQRKKNKRRKGQEQEKKEIPKCLIYRKLDPISGQFILCEISDCEKWYIENQQSGNEDYGAIKENETDLDFNQCIQEKR